MTFFRVSRGILSYAAARISETALFPLFRLPVSETADVLPPPAVPASSALTENFYGDCLDAGKKRGSGMTGEILTDFSFFIRKT